MRELKLRITGRGGQGIVLAGKILGTALAKQGKEVMYSQEYGSRARGGVVYSDLIIAEEEVNEVIIEEADILTALSQEAYKTQKSILKKNGRLILNSDLVEINTGKNKGGRNKVESVPFTTLATQAGNDKTANMVMIAYLNERCDLVPMNVLKKTMRQNLSRLLKENLKAFELGRKKAKE